MSTTITTATQLSVSDAQKFNRLSDQWVADLQQDQTARTSYADQFGIKFDAKALGLRGGINLRGFQTESVQWLLDRYKARTGAILALEMGLGKTLVTLCYMIAMLQSWRDDPTRADHPEYSKPCFLIISPLSVIDGWVDHITNFAPTDVCFIPYTGGQKTRDETQDFILRYRKQQATQWKAKATGNVMASSHPGVDIIITSYETLLQDIEFFNQFHFTNIILDEAHRVKNNMTSMFTILKRVPPPFFKPKCHVTHTLHEQLQDELTCQSMFLDNTLASVTQGVVLGNGNTKQGTDALHSSVKKYDYLKRYAKSMLSYDYAILLTGTLVQNNLAEMWTLFNIVYPQMFPINSQNLYNKCFENIVTGYNFTLPTSPPQHVQHALNNLHAMLDAIMFRRIKSACDIDLPPKTSYVLYTGLTTLQKKLYRAMLGKNQQAFVNCLNQAGLTDKFGNTSDSTTTTTTTTTTTSSSKTTIRGGKKLTQAELNKSIKSLDSIWVSIRKIINHSYLIPGIEPQPYWSGEHLVFASGKLMLLDMVLKKILPKGHRVLIFSPSTQVLDILQDYCEFRNYNAARLDGSIRGSDRGELISSFQKQDANKAKKDNNKGDGDEQSGNGQKRNFSSLGKTTATSPSQTPIFLLSTRAAGVGITLTAADTVIFYDNDFNQAADAQAEQRCYRIGQTKPVMSIRLICKGSIEHLYYLRSVRKAALADAVMREGKFNPKQLPNSGENDYVNIVVPDALLKTVTGDDEEDAAAAAATTTTTTSASTDMTTADDKNAAKDQTALKFAVGLVSNDHDEDDDVDVNDKGAFLAKEFVQRELQKAVMYSSDDIDWITTQGYSPNWDKTAEDLDEEEQDRMNAVKKKQRYLGGLTDFMSAAEVQRGEMHRTKAAFSGKDAKTANEIAAKIEEETKLNKSVFDTTNVATMKLAHFQGLVLEDGDDAENDDAFSMNQRKDKLKQQQQQQKKTNGGGGDDDVVKKLHNKMKVELSSSNDLQKYLASLKTTAADVDENEDDKLIIHDGPRSASGRVMRQKQNTMHDDDNDDEDNYKSSTTKKKTPVQPRAKSITKAQPVRKFNIIDTDDEEEMAREEAERKKRQAAKPKVRIVDSDEEGYDGATTTSKATTTTTSSTTSANKKLPTPAKSTTTSAKPSPAPPKATQQQPQQQGQQSNDTAVDSDTDGDFNHDVFFDLLQPTLSSPGQTLAKFIKYLPSYYSSLRSDLSHAISAVQKKLRRLQGLQYPESAGMLPGSIYEMNETIVSYMRGELLKDSAFFQHLQTAARDHINHAVGGVKEHRETLVQRGIDVEKLEQYYATFPATNVLFSKEYFKEFILANSAQPPAQSELLASLDKLGTAAQQLEQVVLAPQCTDTAKKEQYHQIIKRLRGNYLTFFGRSNTNLFLQQYYNIFNTMPNGQPANDNSFIAAVHKMKMSNFFGEMVKSVNTLLKQVIYNQVSTRFFSLLMPNVYSELSGYFFQLDYIAEDYDEANANPNETPQQRLVNIAKLTQDAVLPLYQALLLIIIDNIFDEVFAMLSASSLATGDDQSKSQHKSYNFTPVHEALHKVYSTQLAFVERAGIQDDADYCTLVFNKPVHIQRCLLSWLTMTNSAWYRGLSLPDGLFPDYFFNYNNNNDDNDEKNKINNIQFTRAYVETLYNQCHAFAVKPSSLIDQANVEDLQRAFNYATLYTRNNLTPPLPFHHNHWLSLRNNNSNNDLDNLLSSTSTSTTGVDWNMGSIAATTTTSATKPTIKSTTTTTMTDFFDHDEFDLFDDDLTTKKTPTQTEEALDSPEYNENDDELINYVAQLHHITGNMLQPENTLGLPTTALYPDQLTAAFTPLNRNNNNNNNNNTINNFPPNDNRTKYITALDKDAIQTPSKFPMARAQGYILLNFADNSGQFGRGGLLQKIKAMSTKLAHSYSAAADAHDLPLGSVCIGAINGTKSNYIANLVVMDKNDRANVNFNHVKASIDKVFYFAKLHNLIILGSKQGYSLDSSDRGAYQNYEKCLQQAAQLFNVDAFVVYFSRQERSKTQQPQQQYQSRSNGQQQSGNLLQRFGNSNNNNNNNNNNRRD